MAWRSLIDDGDIATTPAAGKIPLADGAGKIATGWLGSTVATWDGIVASLRANRALHGGGTITVNASGYVLWSQRFVIISNGRGAHFSTTGYFDVTCPTSGTITGVGGSSNKTATANGIPLSSWEAIYYILPIGSTSTSVAANFRVVTFSSDLVIPESWVLICVRNPDAASVLVHFNNGISLRLGESWKAGESTLSNPRGYVQARGESLVTNGFALMLDNFNFSGLTYEAAQRYAGGGSFKITSGSTVQLIDEFMAVDPNARYRGTYYIKELTPGDGPQTPNAYGMCICYDADKLQISPQYVLQTANTQTTLAVALNPNDTTITLTSSANWISNAQGESGGHKHSINFYPYTNAQGFTYPDYGYSRNRLASLQWNDGAIDYGTHVITLNAPWAGPTYAAGTKVANSLSGGTYVYFMGSNFATPSTWTEKTGTLSGIAANGTAPSDKFWPGTAFVKIGWLLNRDTTNATTTALSAISFGLDRKVWVTATDKVLGRSTAGAGIAEEIPCTASGRAMIAAASAAAQTALLGAATTSLAGIVELATSGENAANVAVQGNDARLSDPRTPTAHTHPYTALDLVSSIGFLGQPEGDIPAPIAFMTAAQAMLLLGPTIYPVGCIYTSVVATNPATLFGFGTWAAFGTGRVLVGIDAADPDFDVVEETGGAKTVAGAGTVSAPTISGSTAAEAAHTHSVTSDVAVDDHSTILVQQDKQDVEVLSPLATHTVTNNAVASGAGSSHSHGVGTLSASVPTHTGSATSVVQPSIVVYRWKRTA